MILCETVSDHAMESLEISRKRNGHACRSCQSLKTKCVPSSESGVCQRCLENHRECTWAEKARVRKRRGPSRIIQVEEKLDGLVARLAEDNSKDSSRTLRGDLINNSKLDSTVRAGDQNLEVGDTGGNFDVDLASIHAFATKDEEVAASDPPSAKNEHNRNHARGSYHELIGDLLSAEQAEKLYEEYRVMAESFPFVPIPPETLMEEMHKEKPMLLLAILTAASWKDRSRQNSLSDRYRYELSQKTIFSPRKDVALVQSLLVYLAWYHFYFSHKSQNILPLLHLLIGLARDLGLNQRDKKSMVSKRKRFRASPYQIRESQRSLLGCFYLSAAITTATAQRLTLLRHNDYISECCDQLQSYGEYHTDRGISTLISLRKIDQDIFDTRSACESEQFMGGAETNSKIRSLRFQLENWRVEHEMESHHLILDLSYHYAKMELNSSALSDRFEEEESNLSPNGYEGTHLKMLDNCLEAAKYFLDTLLAYPTSEYHLITFAHWMRLPRVVITICKLSFSGETGFPQWDVKRAQDRVRLDLYLDSLCYRMQKLSPPLSGSRPTMSDFWGALQKIMENIQKWYLQKIRTAQSVPSASSASTATTPFESSASHTALYSTPASLSLSTAAVLPDGAMGAYDFEMNTMSAKNYMPASFDPDRFMEMDFWGGAGSYDHTIHDTGDFLFD